MKLLDLKLSGLFTNANPLGSVPPGALLAAENVVIDRDDTAELRRGLKLYGNPLFGVTSNRMKQFLNYKKRLIRHYANRLDYQNEGLSVALTASGATVTATTSTPHGLLNQATVTLSGATQDVYNGTYVVTVTSDTTFTYTAVEPPYISPAAGSPIIDPTTFRLYLEYKGIKITSLSGAGTTATAVTATPHGLVNGDRVSVIGATQSAYNIEAVAAVVNATTFTYPKAASASPATGFPQLYASTATISEPEANVKLKSVELSGNLLFSSSEGIKKIDTISSVVIPAGQIKALDLSASLSNGFGAFEINSQVGYKIVWGRKDANDNLGLGNPSADATVSYPVLATIYSDINALRTGLDVDPGLRDTNYNAAPLTPSSSYSDVFNALLLMGYKLDSDIEIGSLVTKFNAMLVKLDNDALGYNDYNLLTLPVTATLAAIQAQLVALAAKLDTDAVIVDTNYNTYVLGGSNLWELRTSFNSIADKLNLPGSGTTDKDYALETGAPSPSYSSILDTNVADLIAAFNQVLVVLDSDTNVAVSKDYAATLSLPSNASLSAILGTTDIATDSFDTKTGLKGFAQKLDADGLGFTNYNTKVGNSTSISNLCTYLNSLVSQMNQDTAIDTSSFAGHSYITPATEEDGPTLMGNYNSFVTKLNVDPQVDSNTYNDATTVQQISLEFTIPNGITTEYFYQVYRTKLSSGADVLPDPRYYLAIEDYPTDAQISANLVTGLIDTTPEDFLGAALYTNDEQEGALQTNDPPPFAKDIAYYQNAVFYGNTKTKHQLSINMLSTLTIADGNTITVSEGANSFVLTFSSTTENAATGTVKFETAGTPGQNVDDTARSMVRVINRYPQNTILYAYYKSGENDVPGNIYLEAKNLNTPAFSLQSATIGAQFSPAFTDPLASTNEVRPNRLYFSKELQGDAVPVTNYIDIGARDRVIQRVIGLRDSLFIFKEDGLYRVSGSVSQGLSSTLFDTTARLIAPESAVSGNNKIYTLMDQGITAVSDSGSELLSRPIENIITPLSQYDSVAEHSFGVFYETERKYQLYMPQTSQETAPSIMFSFNVFTQAWTTATTAASCGIVNVGDNKLYLGAVNTDFIEQERKSYSLNDYADREIPVSIISQSGATLKVGTTAGITIGDVLSQEERLTLGEFNRLLNQLDSDPSLDDTDYLSSLTTTSRALLYFRVVDLATKLAADTGNAAYAALATPPISTIPQLQNRFNRIVETLNADPAVGFADYELSINAGLIMSIISDVKPLVNTITLSVALEFVPAKITTVLQAISAKIDWAPQHGGDPAELKHFREAIYLFTDFSFTKGTVGFGSDLLIGFSEIPFNGFTPGRFGIFPFGKVFFGGGAMPRPLRTYIPLQKQRARYINCRFKHRNALERFALVGLSLVYEDTSARVTR